MITRKQYIDGEVTFEEYYEQFGKHLVDLVKTQFGEEVIKNSKDSTSKAVGSAIMIIVLIGGTILSYGKNQADVDYLRRDLDSVQQRIVSVENKQVNSSIALAELKQQLCSMQKELKDIKEMLRDIIDRAHPNT